MKKVLILCTGNSCRSIIAEAILNHELGKEVWALSSGVAASGVVHPMSLKLLESQGIPTQGLHSKRLDKVMAPDYDLVVTVCDHAKETCPVFPGKAKALHIGMEDPVGMGMEGFEKTARDVRTRLIPALKKELGLD